MIYLYKAITKLGEREEGKLEAFNIESAIRGLQARGLVISSIRPEDEPNDIIKKIPFFNKVSNKDVVILSRQLATLFESQVSVLRVFKLLAAEAENPILRESLGQIVEDLQGGAPISGALSKHPDIFSNFYVNMVKAGEESGHLDKSFSYLADYLDRSYEVMMKARNALVYPIFVLITFIAVMALMFTVVVPKIAVIIRESAQDLPFYTEIVLGVSDFMVNNWLIVIIATIALIAGLVWYNGTEEGSRWLSNAKFNIPYVGDLYRKLYLSRFADNMSTMVMSGIPMLKAVEVTASVIDNDVYRDVLLDASTKVKAGQPLSAALADHKEMPGILVQMMKVGEESGELGNILNTMARFYQREVTNSVNTLVGLIEPVMIVMLAIGVGILLASVLLPIYDVANSIS